MTNDMTFEEFVSMSGKSPNTVKNWIKKGLVNGAKYYDSKYTITNLARPPYTRASSKSSRTIRKGIVVGCKRRLSVNENVFKIPQDEFQVYVDQLSAAGLIEIKKVAETTYYYATLKADSLTDSQIYMVVKDMIKTVASGISEGATSEYLKRTGI